MRRNFNNQDLLLLNQNNCPEIFTSGIRLDFLSYGICLEIVLQSVKCFYSFQTGERLKKKKKTQIKETCQFMVSYPRNEKKLLHAQMRLVW